MKSELVLKSVFGNEMEITASTNGDPLVSKPTDAITLVIDNFGIVLERPEVERLKTFLANFS